jgi:DNA-binding winged helix-turn-helix (wHTH) protein
MIREQDARFIVNAIVNGDCASVIGLSNMGKSTLLRELCAPAAHALLLGDESDDRLFVYVDCNLMPERSEQALHEATLRNIVAALRRSGAQDALLFDLNEFYHQVIEPAAPIRSPIAFDDAIRAVCEQSGRKLTLIFDEFDDPFEKLAGRAFLNLRALKDQFKNGLTYVTATERPLAAIRQDHEASEFIELFDTRERWIGFLNAADATALARELTEDQAASDEDIAFIVRLAGGHAGMLDAVADTWCRIAAGAPESARTDAYALTQQALDDQPNVRAECAKLWAQLTDAEREALISHTDGLRAEPEAMADLRAKRLLSQDDVLVGEVWQTFVRRQALAQPAAQRGVLVDVDSGEVYVDGSKVEPLTELEYKLLLLLYGRLNKIVDKYTIVTNVWGETYLDNVDDARIEKLVSRLRNKLEPGVDEPRYLTTLRGRGYKLVG